MEAWAEGSSLDRTIYRPRWPRHCLMPQLRQWIPMQTRTHPWLNLHQPYNSLHLTWLTNTTLCSKNTELSAKRICSWRQYQHFHDPGQLRSPSYAQYRWIFVGRDHVESRCRTPAWSTRRISVVGGSIVETGEEDGQFELDAERENDDTATAPRLLTFIELIS